MKRTFCLTQFNALLDCVYLTALLASLKETGAESGNDEESTVTHIHKVWSRLHSTITLLFRLSYSLLSPPNPFEYLKSSRDYPTAKANQKKLIFWRIYEKIATVTKEVLGMIDKEELSQILEELSEMVRCPHLLCKMWSVTVT